MIVKNELELWTRTDLRLSASDIEEGKPARISLANLYRTVASLLPAEGAARMGVYSIPALPVNEEDEAIVGALLAKAQEGRTSTKLVTRADLDAAIARAEKAEKRADAAEKRVAELEARISQGTQAHDAREYNAGIREGLERAAVLCERKRVDCIRDDDAWALEAFAGELREMKDGVK